MANFKFDIGQVGITDWLIVQAKRADNLGTIVATQAFSPPHNTIRNIIFPGLDNVPHVFDFRESPDGVTLGTLIGSYNIDAESSLAVEFVFWKVGGSQVDDPINGTDPVDGATQYVNPYMNGKTVTGVFQEGQRFLVDNKEWQPLAGGGVDLLVDDNANQIQFINDQRWSAMVVYAIIPASGGSSSSNESFANIIEVVGDATLDSSHYNSTLLCSSGLDTQVLSAPAIGSVPDKKGFTIHHVGADALPVNVEFLANGADLIFFRGQNVSSVLLGFGEYIKVIKSGAKWYVLEYTGQWDRVGDRSLSDVNNRVNSIVADGQTEYDGLVYKRLYAWLLSALTPGQIKTYAERNLVVVIDGENVNPYRGFWGHDAINKKFYPPDMRHIQTRGIKNIGGSDSDVYGDNIAGAYQHHMFKSHNHTPADSPISTHYGLIGLPVAGNKTVGSTDTTSAEPNVRDTPVSMLTVGGSETSGRNIKQIPIILI